MAPPMGFGPWRRRPPWPSTMDRQIVCPNPHPVALVGNERHEHALESAAAQTGPPAVTMISKVTGSWRRVATDVKNTPALVFVSKVLESKESVVVLGGRSESEARAVQRSMLERHGEPPLLGRAELTTPLASVMDLLSQVDDQHLTAPILAELGALL
jgi:hypothetical protein